MTSKASVLFQLRLRGLQQAMKIHGGHLTIHPDGVYLNKDGKTLANSWEAIGDLLGETWDKWHGD